MKKLLSPAQEQARLDRKAKQAALFARLAKMGDTERALLASKMPVVNVDGHELSIGNMCLLAFQRPAVTVVGGFRQWLAKGRCVRKGEHGLTIRVPVGKAKEGETEGEVFFIGGTVFDVSQTDELEAEHPIASVSPEIAEAFGMANLPNVRVVESDELALA